MRPRTRAGARWIAPALALVALVAAWEGTVRVFDVEEYLLPAPSAVAEAFWDTRGTLPAHLRATASVAVLGLLAGSLAGVALSLPIAVLPLVRRTVQPLLVASQSVPSVVLAPLFVVWWGFGTAPRVLVVALVSFFPIVVATVTGLTGADRDLVELVHAMGANRAEVLWRVRIPHALPSFFSGARIAAAYAMFGAVVAEWIGADRGLGLYLTRSQRSYRTDQVFVAIVLIAAVSIALFTVVAALARAATPWLRPDAAAALPTRPVPEELP